METEHDHALEQRATRPRAFTDTQRDLHALRPGEGAFVLPPEIAFLAGHVAMEKLASLAERARRLGVGVDEILFAARIAPEEVYYRALARHLALPFADLDGEAWRPRGDAAQLVEGAAARLAVLHAPDGRAHIVVAPRGDALRQIVEEVPRRPELAGALAIAAPEALRRYVAAVGAAPLGALAADGLATARPEFSAQRPAPRHIDVAIIVALVAAFLTISGHPVVAPIVHGMMAAVFLGGLGLRVALSLVPPLVRPLPMIADRALPPYSILVPLYREAAVVPKLVRALAALDYPHAKLEVIFLVEADDAETSAALAAVPMPFPGWVLTVPDIGPRTKPKALAAALPFVRGKYVTIYDAEDVPDPDQLRRAVARFAEGPRDLACLQASLAIDNARDCPLTALFAAEYAALFDATLPNLAAMGQPFPLGGTSNHFATAILRKVGGWDPYNVTEDADLGLRLARFGYRAGVLDSVTWEEAPNRHGAWIGQRSRWLKGWMQTAIVHFSRPQALVNDIGLLATITFAAIGLSSLAAPLLHPLLLAITIGELVANGSSGGLKILLLGYAASAFAGLVGLARHGLLGLAPALLLTPLYWISASAAAYRAVWSLRFRPSHWQKTTHGKARTSLIAEAEDEAVR